MVAATPIPFIGHADTAPLMLLSNVLSNTILHREIREKGGAYGAGCSCRPLSGTLNLWSYRDPNLINTIKVFENLDVDINALDEAKLTLF